MNNDSLSSKLMSATTAAALLLVAFLALVALLYMSSLLPYRLNELERFLSTHGVVLLAAWFVGLWRYGGFRGGVLVLGIALEFVGAYAASQPYATRDEVLLGYVCVAAAILAVQWVLQAGVSGKK